MAQSYYYPPRGDGNNCPPRRDIAPCWCMDSTISCHTSEEMDLKDILKTIAYFETYWDVFELSSHVITELEDSVFNGVHFRIIKILQCSRLTCVDPRAFDGMERRLEEFIAEGTSFRDVDKSGCNIFEAIKRFPKLKVITITGSDITRIPEESFYSRTTDRSDLEYLDLSNQRGGKITSIGSRAFATLDRLKYIDLSYQLISEIEPEAFYFKNEGDFKLVIKLENNRLTEESFKENTFYLNGRRLSLRLSFNPNMHLLKEEVFGKILLAQNRFVRRENNIIDVKGSPLACIGENVWLLKYKQILDKMILNAESDTGQEFWEHRAQSCDKSSNHTQNDLSRNNQ